MARHPVAGPSLPGLLNKHAGLDGSILKIIHEISNILFNCKIEDADVLCDVFAITFQPVGALFVTASAPRGAAVDRRLNRARSEALHSAEFGARSYLCLPVCI